MAYISNPYMGKVRRLAVNDVLYRGLTYEEVGLRYGVTKSAVCKWMKRADPDHRVFIETTPPRPHHHPNELTEEIVQRIIKLREQTKRCAPIIHAHLKREGVVVSLSSVARTLRREGLVRKKKPAVWGSNIPRPVSTFPGALVQADTIHFVRNPQPRFYVYAVIDTFSRLGFAQYQPQLRQNVSVGVLLEASSYFGFPFEVVQTDHGPEFSQGFGASLRQQRIQVRHSRVRHPNDNAHIERFNRTLQEECFRGRLPNPKTAQQQLGEYLAYYNNHRLHLSLDCQTPREYVSKVLT